MPVQILFICLGNICRSPTAEGIMNTLLEQQGLSEQIRCDSAGTSAYHNGEAPDARMSEHALKRGYKLGGRSRRFRALVDFEAFDYIITMDDANYSNVLAMDSKNQYFSKIFKMTDFCRHHVMSEVPDPYFGGNEGFEVVINLLEDACRGLLEKVLNEHGIANPQTD
ncbi:MAG: low molecular weight phosphotyrosine protein phosphatase [SAR324 cluster bacterium]|nr:low molecular weight phosphotyrosine protein phosphatase [SAR324 cluster bacterium]